MQRILEARFRALLSEQGWSGPTDFYWSLGYCQGDGVSFYGRLDDPVALIKRLAPSSLVDAFVLPFARDHGTATITIEKQHRGYGGPWMSLDIDVAEALDDRDEDTGHQTILKQIANDNWSKLESLIKEDLRRVERLLTRAGYEVMEAADPCWWAGLPDSETHDGRHVVFRTARLAQAIVEWRLIPLELDWIGEDEAQWYAQCLTGTHVGCDIACVAVDEDGDEIARSPAYATVMPKDTWRKSEELWFSCRESFADIKDDLRAYLHDMSGGISPVVKGSRVAAPSLALSNSTYAAHETVACPYISK